MNSPEHTQDRAEAKEAARDDALTRPMVARSNGLSASFGSASAAVARRGFALGRKTWRPR